MNSGIFPRTDATNLLAEHRTPILNYVRRIVRDESDAEDLTQETFVRAIRQLGTLRQDAALQGWLYRIATNVCLDRLRQRSRLSAREEGGLAEDLPVADHRCLPALKVVEQQQMSACVQQYIAQLPGTYRIVVLLSDAGGATTDEIAELLALPLTAVKMRLHRARRKLQAMLQEGCAFGQDERGVLVCDRGPRDDQSA